MSMKNSNETIGNRTRDLPACSAVPQPTAPPRHRANHAKFNPHYVAPKKLILNKKKNAQPSTAGHQQF